MIKLTASRFAFNWIPDTTFSWTAIYLWTRIFTTRSIACFRNGSIRFASNSINSTLIKICNTVSSTHRFFDWTSYFRTV